VISLLLMMKNVDNFCCFRYFAQNFDWLDSAVDDIEDDYLLFDCPGRLPASILSLFFNVISALVVCGCIISVYNL